MKRVWYRSVLLLGITIGVASLIGITGFSQCYCSSPAIQNVRIDNFSGVPKIEFEATRWTYVFIFNYRPGVGWEATYPIVASQVKRYSPGSGCHTITNGMIRYATKIRVVTSDTPCFAYPQVANGVMYASQIRFIGGQNVRVYEFNLMPACQNLRPQPPPQYCTQPCYTPSCCLNICCNPCCVPLWLFLLIVMH